MLVLGHRPARAEVLRVEVLAPDWNGVYGELRAALVGAVQGLPVLLQFAVAGQAGANGAAPPQLVLTLGTQALRQAASRAAPASPWAGVPVLAALLPQAAYQAQTVALPRGSSAVWLDQPVARFLELLRLALPTQRRVGVLFGPTSKAQAAALARAAEARGQELVAATLAQPSDELYPSLRRVLQNADVLLALPDPLLYTPEALQNILIAAYRQRVPLLSYAASHARAGATLALHTPLPEVAAQVVQALRQFAAGQGLPAPAGAQGYAVAVNEQVAHSLSLNLRPAAEWEAALRRTESRP